MKKWKFAFALLTIFGLTFLVFGVAHAETQPKILIDPATRDIKVGESISVNIKVDGAKDLLGWQTDITFEPKVLEFGKVTEGSFLKKNGNTYFIPGTSESGAVKNIACALMGQEGLDGSGTLVSLDFKVVGEGSSEIKLENHLLSNSAAQPISHTSANGSVSVPVTPLPTQATASSSTSLSSSPVSTQSGQSSVAGENITNTQPSSGTEPSPVQGSASAESSTSTAGEPSTQGSKQPASAAKKTASGDSRVALAPKSSDERARESTRSFEKEDSSTKEASATRKDKEGRPKVPYFAAILGVVLLATFGMMVYLRKRTVPSAS